MDELTLTLPQHIREETRKGVEASGGTWTGHPPDDRRPHGRARPQGRSSGKGFYEYDETGKRIRLWPGLSEEFGAAKDDLPFEDMQERMLFAEALETVKCFDEGVLHTIADANIGSIIGIGFPAWTGVSRSTSTATPAACRASSSAPASSPRPTATASPRRRRSSTRPRRARRCAASSARGCPVGFARRAPSDAQERREVPFACNARAPYRQG